jgi:peptidoglycan/LPS O-acetylase OafA/YrhL
MKKIHQLEGVRGIGCLIVFVCHFQIVFLPEFYHLILAKLQLFLPANLSNFIIYMVDLSLIGNMFLHIFWALSAYVIFKKFFELNSRENLLSSTVKRYVRLMVPCAASIFFSYFLFKFGFIYIRGVTTHVLQQNLYAFEPSFWKATVNSLWNTLFEYNYADSYNGPLWTIEREFYGSLFCFGLFGVIGLSGNRSYFYMLIFGCALALKMYWLNSFLFGYYLSDFDFSVKHQTSIVYYIINKLNNFMLKRQVLNVLIFLVAFAGLKYIPYKSPENLDLVNSVLCIWVIVIALRVDFVAKAMCYPVLNKLGQISFGLYLLHWPFMCAFTSWYYLKFDHSTYLSLGILFVLTLALSLALAWLFYRVIDITSIKWASKIAKYLNKVTRQHPAVYAAAQQQV